MRTIPAGKDRFKRRGRAASGAESMRWNREKLFAALRPLHVAAVGPLWKYCCTVRRVELEHLEN